MALVVNYPHCRNAPPTAAQRQQYGQGQVLTAQQQCAGERSADGQSAIDQTGGAASKTRKWRPLQRRARQNQREQAGHDPERHAQRTEYYDRAEHGRGKNSSD